MIRPFTNTSRELAVDARRTTAVRAWDAEPIAEPSLELLLLPPPMTNSAYLFGRNEGRGAALDSAALGGLAAGGETVGPFPLRRSPNAGRPRAVSRALRPSRNERGRR